MIKTLLWKNDLLSSSYLPIHMVPRVFVEAQVTYKGSEFSNSDDICELPCKMKIYVWLTINIMKHNLRECCKHHLTFLQWNILTPMHTT